MPIYDYLGGTLDPKSWDLFFAAAEGRAVKQVSAISPARHVLEISHLKFFLCLVPMANACSLLQLSARHATEYIPYDASSLCHVKHAFDIILLLFVFVTAASS
jgi:hypothetical protein